MADRRRLIAIAQNSSGKLNLVHLRQSKARKKIIEEGRLKDRYLFH